MTIEDIEKLNPPFEIYVKYSFSKLTDSVTDYEKWFVAKGYETKRLVFRIDNRRGIMRSWVEPVNFLIITKTVSQDSYCLISKEEFLTAVLNSEHV